MGGKTAAGIDIYESGRAADKNADPSAKSTEHNLHLETKYLTPDTLAER